MDKSLSERVREFIFGDDAEVGRVSIVTTRGRVKFHAELRNADDYDRAIGLLVEEREILFPTKRKEKKDV